MNTDRYMVLPLSWAHVSCAAAYAAALALASIDIAVSLIPLAIFLLLCAAAPFFPRYGFFLPVVSRGAPGAGRVSLTFDDGPDPETTPLVLSLLKKHGVRAVFFVSGERARRYPELIRNILDDGHSIGNHTYHHRPWVMLRDSRTLRSDVVLAQELFMEFGLYPLAFRPPAGITNPKLWRILIDAGMYCVNFSRRAGDMGNRRIDGLASKILHRLGDGDIVLLHDTAPSDRSRISFLMEQFERIIAGIGGKRLSIVPLEECIGREVMLRKLPGEDSDNLRRRAFHCSMAAGLSGTYESTLSGAAELPRLIAHSEKTLIMGESQRLLERYGQLSASDCSGPEPPVNDGPGRTSKRYDLMLMSIPYPALEADIDWFFKKVRQALHSGGTFCFPLPRLGPGAVMTSLSFALKQGFWLHLRLLGSITRSLHDTGFVDVRTEPSCGGYIVYGSVGDKDTLSESLIFS